MKSIGIGAVRFLFPGGVCAAGLVAALALGAQETKAQPVFQCPAASPPVTAVFPEGFDLRLLTGDHLRAIFRAAGPIVIPTEPVDCGFVNHDGTRNVVVRNPRITVNEDLYAGISAWRQGGNGDLVVYVHGVDATGAPQHFHPIDHGRYAVRTMGDGEWNVGEESYGVWASHTGRGRVAIDFRDLSLSTAGGDAAHGIYATQQGSYFYENGKTHRSRGAVIVNVIETERDREGRVRPLVGTRGDESDAIRAEYTRAAAKGHIAITVEGYTIATGGIVPKGPQFPNNQGVPGVEDGPLFPSLNGYESRAIHTLHEGLGDIRVAVTDSHILTWGISAHGILADHTGRSETITNLDRTTEVREGGGAIDIDVTGGEIRTAGANSSAIYGWHRGAGDVAIDATGVAIATAGEESQGILAWIRQATTWDRIIVAGTEPEVIAGTGEGDIAISVTGGAISTQGESAHAVWGRHDYEGDIAIRMAGGATAATKGARAHGVFAEHQGAKGDIAVTIEGDSVATEGDNAHGVYVSQGIRTTTRSEPDDRTPSGIKTVVENKYGGSGDLTIAVAGGDVATAGESSDGVRAVQGGSGALVVVVSGGTVRAAGYQAHGIHALRAVNDEGRISVTVSGGSVVAEGSKSAGVYVNGAGEAEVTVGRDGRVSAASGIGIYSNGPGDLNVKVAGRVEGDVFHSGTGALVLDLPEGGVVTGTVHDPRNPIVVRGSVGRLFYSTGASVTVARGGKLTGVEVELDGVKQTQAIRSLADDLTVTVQGGGAITGDIISDGNLTATVRGAVTGHIVNESGRLAATVAGTVYGDIRALGSGDHMLTLESGSMVTGTVRRATTGTITAGGTVGRLRFDRGGLAVVGEDGEILGIDGNGISSGRGALTAEVRQGAGESPADALLRAFGDKRFTITVEGGRPTVQTRVPGEEARILGALGTASSAVHGAYDVGVALGADGSVQVSQEFAPRSRVYEALPSVLLALNGLPTAGERMVATRDSAGAWGRIEGAHGSWTADRSTTGAEYDLQRLGARTGLETPVDEAGSVLGLSLYQRDGLVEVPRGGDISVQSFGVGIYGTLVRREGLYVDGQAETTWYEVALDSSPRGRLNGDVSGHGYALGVEAGRRMAMGLPAMGEVVVTPRARLVRSAVSLSDFEDSVNVRVSLDKGRSLRGRVGVHVETRPLGEVRLSGAVDVEREFQQARQVTVGGTALPAQERATRFHLGLGGVYGWEGGRYALAGKVDYATSGGGDSHEYGGGLNLTVRF